MEEHRAKTDDLRKLAFRCSEDALKRYRAFRSDPTLSSIDYAAAARRHEEDFTDAGEFLALGTFLTSALCLMEALPHRSPRQGPIRRESTGYKFHRENIW
jgi:hypothetical protein